MNDLTQQQSHSHNNAILMEPTPLKKTGSHNRLTSSNIRMLWKKKRMSLFLLMLILFQTGYAQNNAEETKNKLVIYSVFINSVPDNFKFPLIGFINLATGSHQGLQLGFINWTQRDFNGAQIGFVNTTLKYDKGLQLGFVNTSVKDLNGIQIGFLNTGSARTQGLQLGFVNTSVKTQKGNQIGFFNYADTATGIPIGFISIVKKGGYIALEASVNELYPVNILFKIGVPKLYSYAHSAYNPQLDKPFALGFGFGSLLPLSQRLYFNPEIGSLNPVAYGNRTITTSLAANIRYSISPKWQIAAGPSISWLVFPKDDETIKPFFLPYNQRINDSNRIGIGARIALSYSFMDCGPNR